MCTHDKIDTEKWKEKESSVRQEIRQTIVRVFEIALKF